jgi:uncharacterized protein YbaP (TraB family)
MNRSRSLPFLLSALLALFVAPVAPAQQASTSARTRHPLWVVQGKKCSVALLGSVHLLKAEDYPLPAVMEDAFTNSAIVAFETDIGGLENTDTRMRILTKGRLPDGETLASQLSPAVFSQFTNHLAQTGMDQAIFDQLKPSLAALTLVVLEIQKLGFDPQIGIDRHFFKAAKRDGKQIVPLETVDFQISLITDLSKDENELLMKVTLEDIDKTKKEFRELIAAWKTGDAGTLERMLNEASKQAPAIYKRMVTDRNQRWLPQVETWLGGEKNVIVIVGAGHLVGEEGVVELLRKKGWKITQPES